MAALENNPGRVACGYPDRSITRVGVSKHEFPMHSSSPATRVEREGPNFQKKINNNDNKNTKILTASSVVARRVAIASLLILRSYQLESYSVERS